MKELTLRKLSDDTEVKDGDLVHHGAKSNWDGTVRAVGVYEVGASVYEARRRHRKGNTDDSFEVYRPIVTRVTKATP